MNLPYPFDRDFMQLALLAGKLLFLFTVFFFFLTGIILHLQPQLLLVFLGHYFLNREAMSAAGALNFCSHNL